MKKYFCVDFSDDEYGIEIMAESETEVREIVNNPSNWKDGRIRTISSIKESWR